MKFLIAPAYILFITAGLVTSQKCPPCPAFAVGGGLAVIAATCTSVLASTLYLRNEACSDQVKSKDKHCTEKRRIIDESLVTCNDRNVVLNQERETVMNELEEQRELLSNLSDAVCDGIAEFELCKRCLVITTALECITQPGCLFLEDPGACTFEINED